MSGTSGYLSRNLAAGVDNLTFTDRHNQIGLPLAPVPLCQNGRDREDDQIEIVLSLRHILADELYGRGAGSGQPVPRDTVRRLSTDSSASAAPPPYSDAVLNLQEQSLVKAGGQRSSYSSAPPSYLDAVINNQSNIPRIHGQRLPVATGHPVRPATARPTELIGEIPGQPQSDDSEDGCFAVRATGHNFPPHRSLRGNPINNRRHRPAAADNTQRFSGPVRRVFVRNVFCTLTIQFLASSHIAVFVFVGLNNKTNWIWYMILAGLVAIALTIMTYTWKWPRQKCPQNVFLLGILTLSYSVFAGIFAAYFDAVSLLYSTLMTTAVCLAFTIFSLQSKQPLTYWSSFFVLSVVLVVIVSFFLGIRMSYPAKLPPIKTILLAFLQTIAVSILIIYDVMRIMDRMHKFVISPQQIVIAAIAAYVDIIMIPIIFLLVSFCGNVADCSGRDGGFDKALCVGVCFSDPEQNLEETRNHLHGRQW